MTDNTEEKKVHRIGWWRSLYYYMGWDYESDNDKPLEKDVLKKQVLCKQINLSKLKMKKVIIEPKIPFDLQKIYTDEKEKETKPQEMSIKQRIHKYGSRYNNLP
jgi:hypothetical protein